MNTETAKPRVSYADFQAQRNDAWMQSFKKIKSRGEGVKYEVGGVQYTAFWIHEDPPWVQVSYRSGGKVTHGMVYPGNPFLLEMKPLDGGTS